MKPLGTTLLAIGIVLLFFGGYGAWPYFALAIGLYVLYRANTVESRAARKQRRADRRAARVQAGMSSPWENLFG